MSTPPLFETQVAKGRTIYRLFAASVFTSICMIWTYRLIHMPQNGTWAWLGMLLSELWFGFYWFLTQSHRWKPVFRTTFKDRLSHRFEKELPCVDVFVCTADAALEPPVMVINTVLSVMAYDYPPEKLSVYLSDDGGSALTFYALLEASKFAKHWLPYCSRFKVETRSPAAFFKSIHDHSGDADFIKIKELYIAMETRIDAAVKTGRVPKELLAEDQGNWQWNLFSSKKDHDTILQILVDGRNLSAKDIEGSRLPTLVYLAREKRSEYHHNNKAGAMNALLRVSDGISSGQIILNVDCDMYSNNSQSVRDALCFFMDEEKGSEVGFVQFPQNFENVTQNDIYGSSMRVVSQIEFQGLDSYGGPMYIGTGCFHRRDSLCGMKYTKGYKNKWTVNNDVPDRSSSEATIDLERSLKHLATCTYESNTQWGKEMGLKYGCPVEDVLTGVAIQCRGWKSIFYNPARTGFLGVGPTTLAQTLVQHKRWSEGDFQVFFSKHGPIRYGFGKISLGLQMGYSVYCLWAPNCLATIYYSLVPPLALLKGIPLFPQVSSPWFHAFAYVLIAENAYSFGEFLWAGGTAEGWWNEQRIWLYKRCSSYLLALVDTFLWIAGSTGSAFIITAKVSNQEVTKRYYNELIEFGASSQMFVILATLALINLFSLVMTVASQRKEIYKTVDLQILLCATCVLLNLPLYIGMFLRRDGGKMPISVTLTSMVLATATCVIYTFT
ncbi:unnamed protein product [Rhodiola kirilowii]